MMEEEHQIVFMFEDKPVKASLVITNPDKNLTVYHVRPADLELVRRFGQQISIRRNEIEFEKDQHEEDEEHTAYYNAIIYGILAKRL